MDVAKAFTLADERLREAGGSRDGTHSIPYTETEIRDVFMTGFIVLLPAAVTDLLT